MLVSALSALNTKLRTQGLHREALEVEYLFPSAFSLSSQISSRSTPSICRMHPSRVLPTEVVVLAGLVLSDHLGTNPGVMTLVLKDPLHPHENASVPC
jgi:hypothetical protein